MMYWLLLAALPLCVLTIALVNLLTWRRGDPNALVGGSVSILIPARNEEKNIARALQSIPSTIPGIRIEEILVYDDQSTDSTRRVVTILRQTEARIRLLSGVPLPSGWVGKPHALSQLADAARGDFLLFMDADVELKPEGLTRLLSLTLAPVRGRVVTAMPEQISGTFFERLVLPLLPLTYLAWLPLRLVEHGNDSRTVAANGQLLLIKRCDYQVLGGFEAVKNEIVDDVAFCRHAKQNKMRVVFADGTLMARCRMYEGARETIEGFSKNFYEGVGGRFGTIAAILLYSSAFLLPYCGVIAALLIPEWPGTSITPAAVGVGANLALQAILIIRYGQPSVGILLHPFSVLAFIGIALNSWKWHARGRVVWAGRTYGSMENRDTSKVHSHQRPVIAPNQKEHAR